MERILLWTTDIHSSVQNQHRKNNLLAKDLFSDTDSSLEYQDAVLFQFCCSGYIGDYFLNLGHNDLSHYLNPHFSVRLRIIMVCLSS